MRIVLASIAGSVGKTTIAAHMFCPRMPKARVFAVETTNMTVSHFGIPAEELSSEEFKDLYKKLSRIDDAIVDVGGSKEAKQFLAAMDWLEGHDEVDAFVVPAMPEDKDQKAAYQTIELLMAQGVSKDKIKVIFNAVQKNTVAEFDYLLGALTVNNIPFAIEATIFRNDLYDLLSQQKRSLASVLSDTTDYKAIMRKMEAETDADETEIERLANLMIAQKGAPKVNANLDTVYSALFR